MNAYHVHSVKIISMKRLARPIRENFFAYLVLHVFSVRLHWECALFDNQRRDFLQSLKESLEMREFDDFLQLERFGRTAFILSCNRLEDNT